MIINKSFSYWKIDGNRNWKFDCQEAEFRKNRKPGDETLEEEYLRLFPKMWEKVSEPSGHQRFWHKNSASIGKQP